MWRAILLLFLTALPALDCSSGPDVHFSFLGDHYTGGGTTRAEKRAHYDQEMRKWGDYDK